MIYSTVPDIDEVKKCTLVLRRVPYNNGCPAMRERGIESVICSQLQILQSDIGTVANIICTGPSMHVQDLIFGIWSYKMVFSSQLIRLDGGVEAIKLSRSKNINPF